MSFADGARQRERPSSDPFADTMGVSLGRIAGFLLRCGVCYAHSGFFVTATRIRAATEYLPSNVTFCTLRFLYRGGRRPKGAELWV